ncbi:MAG: hypothetical protein ACK5GU_07035 [Chloroflexota bacterium]|jgi:hypothetical protein
MYRKLIVFVWVAIVLATSMLVPPQVAEAGIGAIATTCRVYDRSGYTVSAANHPNGLIYIAVSDSDSSAVDNLRNKARIVIRAIDPANVRSGGDCTSAQYFDSYTYTTYSVLVTPTIIRSDSAGNLYVGKINQDGFRLIYIPATATKANPFGGLTQTMVTGVGGGPFVSMGGMAVTNNHVLVGAATFESGKKFYGFYRVLTTTQVARGGSYSGGWNSLSNFALYGTQNSAIDSFAGLSNGKFFIGGSFEYTTPKFIALGGILDPVTNTITGVTGSAGKLDPLPCSNATIGMIPYGCFYPSGQMGDNGILYVSYGVGQAVANIRHNFIVRYNLNTNRWENLNGVPNNATRIPQFSGTEASGLGKYIDGGGNIYAAGTNGVRGPLMLAAYENGSWSDKGFNIGNTEWGKPAVLISRFGNESRLSVFYVSLFDGDVYWTTYRGSFVGSASSCSERIRFENGATAINDTSATGTITVGTTCLATKYATVISASATKPTTNPTRFTAYNKANPVINVTGLAANMASFIHVRLYDVANRPASNWITTRMVSDTDSTIGVTTTLTSQYSTPYFLDASSSGGSTFANSAYTRGMVGNLTITGVTDLSGLASFQPNGSNERAYTSALLNQSQTVFLQTTSNPDEVGTTIRFTDIAGNVEDRTMTLIYDTEPPTVTGATISQTSTDNTSFVRTFTVGGSVTDNKYPAPGYWGVWVAIERIADPTSPPAADDTASTLKWGAIPVTSGSFEVNLLNGTSDLLSSGDYRVYIRYLDGAGNASSTGANVIVSVDAAVDTNKIYVPYITLQR